MKRHKPVHLDAEYMRDLLKRCAVEAGSQKEAAAILKISPQYFNDVVRGKREVSAELAERLGFEKVVSFVSRRIKL